MSKELIKRTLRKARQTAFEKDRSRLIDRCKVRLGVVEDHGAAAGERYARTMWL